MSDDAAAPEPAGHAEDPPISEEELMRYTMQYARKQERDQAEVTTDADGNPYPASTSTARRRRRTTPCCGSATPCSRSYRTSGSTHSS